MNSINIWITIDWTWIPNSWSMLFRIRRATTDRPVAALPADTWPTPTTTTAATATTTTTSMPAALARDPKSSRSAPHPRQRYFKNINFWIWIIILFHFIISFGYFIWSFTDPDHIYVNDINFDSIQLMTWKAGGKAPVKRSTTIDDDDGDLDQDMSGRTVSAAGIEVNSISFNYKWIIYSFNS